MPAIVPGIILVGAAVSAWQQHRQGQQAQQAGVHQQAAANSEADLQDYNAKVADLQARDAVVRGSEEESRLRTQTRGIVGTQRAGFAASNIDVGFGSAVDVQADASYLGELDALTVRNNAAREAWGFQQSAEDLRRRATIARKEGVYLADAGRQAATTGNIAAAGTLIGGTTSLLKAKYGFDRARYTPDTAGA